MVCACKIVSACKASGQMQLLLAAPVEQRQATRLAVLAIVRGPRGPGARLEQQGRRLGLVRSVASARAKGPGERGAGVGRLTLEK